MRINLEYYIMTWKILICDAGEWEKIRWTDRVKNEVLHEDKERNILHAVKRSKANWISHILRRNRLLRHVIQGNIVGRREVTRGRERIRKQLLDGLKETRGYWKLK